MGFEFRHTDIEFLGTVIENVGIKPSVKPKTILNNFNKSLNISFHPNVTLYLQISDPNFITPFLNPLSTIETFVAIKGENDIAFIIYLKVIRINLHKSNFISHNSEGHKAQETK